MSAAAAIQLCRGPERCGTFSSPRAEPRRSATAPLEERRQRSRAKGGSTKRMPSEQIQPSICSCRESLEPFAVQLLGDRLQRHPPTEHRVDLHPPRVVAPVAEPVREPDVVGREVTSVRLESRIVVRSRPPIGPGPRRSRVEVATTAEAVALGHLATHVDDLAIARELPKDSANSQRLEPLYWSDLSVRRCRRGSGVRRLVYVVHARVRILEVGPLWAYGR